MSAKFGTNRLEYEHRPRNLLTSDTLVGLGHFLTASSFSGSVTIPLALTMCPRNFS